MQAWAGFYTVIGGAAAALLGLLFVTISINTAVALGPEDATSRRLAEQSFQNYLAVLLVALLALFANIPPAVFGLVSVLATATWSVWVLIRLGQTLASHPLASREGLHALRRHMASVIGFGLLLTAGARMALGWHEERLFAAALIVLLFAATMSSWELLTRVAARRS